MPIRHGDKEATVSTNRSRRTVRRSTDLPVASTPCSENTFFARSIPTVVICSTDFPSGYSD